jgi:MoaA/NifB/PqqE/SkfB family radical SAM enzyme
MTSLTRAIKDRIPQSVKRKYHDRRREKRLSTQGSLDTIRAIIEDMKTRSPEDVFRAEIDDPVVDVEEAPIHVSAIEINDSCNLNCAMCETKKAERGKKGLMDLDKFREGVEKLCARGMRSTNLHTLGDPIANRNLRSYLEILRDNNVYLTNFSTNGLMLKRHMDTLFEFRDNIGTMRFSIDGATKPTYERIRVGGKFETLHENLLAFTERNQAASNPFGINVSAVVSADNYHELAMIPHVFSYLAPPTSFSFGMLAAQEPVHAYFNKFNLFGENFQVRQPCNRNWRSLFVLKNGDMTTCCQDYHGDIIFGNLFEDNVDEAYNSDFMKGVRKAHLENDIPSMPKICQGCYVVDPRLDEVFNGIFQYFFRNVRKHPVYLQQALNEMRPKLAEMDMDGVMEIVEKL